MNHRVDPFLVYGVLNH